MLGKPVEINSFAAENSTLVMCHYASEESSHLIFHIHQLHICNIHVPQCKTQDTYKHHVSVQYFTAGMMVMLPP